MKKAFTLSELLISTTVFVIGIVGILSLYTNSKFLSMYSNELTTATADAQTVLESIKSMSLSDIIANKDSSSYWNGLVSNKTLSSESIVVENTNTSDTSWSNDPLGLRVRIQWNYLGTQKNVEMVTKITDL